MAELRFVALYYEPPRWRGDVSPWPAIDAAARQAQRLVTGQPSTAAVARGLGWSRQTYLTRLRAPTARWSDVAHALDALARWFGAPVALIGTARGWVLRVEEASLEGLRRHPDAATWAPNVSGFEAVNREED